MISNGLIALCGAVFAQNDGFSDVTSGTGTIVVGLSAVIIARSTDPRIDHWLAFAFPSGLEPLCTV